MLFYKNHFSQLLCWVKLSYDVTNITRLQSKQAKQWKVDILL